MNPRDEQPIRSDGSLGSITWQNVEESVKSGRVGKVIIPLGSLEQHGPHLPLSTDSIIAEHIAKAVHEKCPGTLLTPTLPLGCSTEHLGFPGTVSLQAETLTRVLFEIAQSLSQSKLNKVFIINGHGGNRPIIETAASQIANRIQELNFYAFTIVDIVKEKFEDVRKSPRRFVGHADEIETSMMLAIEPELVDMSKAVNQASSLPAALSFEASDLTKVSFGWTAKKLSRSGVIGDALYADAEEGKVLIDHAVRIIAETINQL